MKSKVQITKMRDKWKKNESSGDDNNSSISIKYALEEPYKPKLLRHTPSLKAIKTYNDLPIEGNFDTTIDTSVFFLKLSPNSLRKYDGSIISRDSLGSDTKSNENNSSDYATVGTISNSGSELNSDQTEMGSTAKLISPKVPQSWQIWSPHITTTICTICMAAGLGNLYRLPQTTFIRGGLPFLIVYIVLLIVVGLPLLFLELGLGQLAQEGVIKAWRAVPFFKGIGYIKLLACCVLSVYYPLYMGISLYYIIWMLKGSVPFQECSAGVKITEFGYLTYGKNGQQCLRTTFLKNPAEDPYWYGIFVSLLLLIWFIIIICSIKKTRSYIKSLVFLIIPLLGCWLYLLIKSILLQNDSGTLREFFNNIDWSLLNTASIWYYASIQVFFSTNVGFGSFITNAGMIYNKVNPFWTALGYIILNTIFGFGSIIISQSLTNQTNVNMTGDEGDVGELYLVSLIYDIGISNRNTDLKTWAVVFHFVILLSGFISMATLIYTLLKALTVQTRNNLKWWHSSIVLSFIGYILGCLVLLVPDFDIVHLLDHYIVGNLILITTVIEILALIAFYGIERIKSDFEFMLGHLLSKIWLVLWWLIPLFLTSVFAWAMTTLPMEGIFKEDASWLYGVGWGIILSATLFIFAVGIYVVTRQDGYTFADKFKASVKPSNKWGPKDPMSRHTWIQWNSKAQQGERDFTLKRKGTRDYTRSIKKNKKVTISELSTLSVPGVYKTNNSKQTVNPSDDGNIYTEIPNINSQHINNEDEPSGTLRVVSLPNTSSQRNLYSTNDYDLRKSKGNSLPDTFDINENTSKIYYNPLSDINRRKKFQENGTLRKGPYVISSDVDADHVCQKKSSENKEITEL